MSTRLKRKLNNLGVDVGSSKANENFCLIGTPLPPLEKSKDTGEFVPLWKQEVRDEKGRRRLHGAFTGGFSAGYFNTVGSKEGWTPSNFVSSRGDRAKAKAARPEDFMDEEDLQELRENRMIVDTTQEMDLTAGTIGEIGKAQSGDDLEQDSIVHALQSSLLPAPNESVGARILKKMGWRIGSGIGPRVSLRQHRLQELQASSPYGTRAVVRDVKLTEDDEEANKHTYAPRDTPVLVVERKTNVHGIGYQSGLTLHESVGSSKQASTKDTRISAGFGLGALNDADDDDLDVYDTDVKTVKNQLPYDAQHHNDVFTLGSRGVHPESNKGSVISYSAVFRDGTRVLAGFVLSEKVVVDDRWFELPEIPPGWQPNPNTVWEGNKETMAKPKIGIEPMDHNEWKSSGMTAGERGSMLGEVPLHSKPRSVFDYLSEKDRERLKATGAAVSSDLLPSTTKFSMPRTEPHIAEAALKGFQPFTSDPAKQDRYTRYLRSQVTPDAPPLEALANQRIDEFQKEVDDYAKAATIFRPVSGAMAGRFQSATHIEHGPRIHEGLHQPTAAELDALDERRKKEEEEKLSPQAHAAKLGMYGPMTREVKSWQPARLLCKRFGLKEPEIPQDDVEGDLNSRKGPSFTTTEAEEAFRQMADAGPGAKSSSSVDALSGAGGSRNLSTIGLGDDETQGHDTLTYQRPAMDIFKAIFASDDEDSDDENLDGKEAGAVEDEKEAPINGVHALPPQSVLDDAPVDLATFKPTFKPRGGKAKEKEGDRIKSKEKKEKRKKDKRGPLVSFDVEEGEEDERPSLDVFKEAPKRRKLDRHGRSNDDNDDGGVWVEKPPPDVVKSLSESSAPSLQVAPAKCETAQAQAVTPANDVDATTVDSGTRKSRKRAIDFM